MASSNPPHHSAAKLVQPTILSMLRGARVRTFSVPVLTSPLVMSALAPTPKAYTATSAVGLRLVQYLPDTIHSVAMSELGGQFVPNVAARFVQSPVSPAPAFGIHSGIGAPFSYPGADTPPIIDAQVAALRGALSSAFLAEAQDQIEWPSLWLAAALGLHESVQNGLGLATCFAMDTAFMMASQLNMHLKESLGVQRPNDSGWTAPVLTPLLPMPGNRSFPAGHAMTLTAVVTLLQSLLGTKSASCTPQLQAVAQFLMFNRHVTGMHTQVDNEVGVKVGVWLGQQLLVAETLPAQFPHWAALCELARSEWV